MSAPTVPPRGSGVRRTAWAAVAGGLAAVTLKGLFRDYGWLLDVWITMIIVVAPALVLRLRRPPGALDIWPGVVLMIPWLTGRFVPDHAWLGIIPSGGTIHDVSLLLDDLHRTTQHDVAPIQTTVAVRLVICALLGLLAALIDLIAVVGRRGALAGVPLLVVYTVCGAVPRRPVAWTWFLLAAVGFLILLSLDAEDDLRGWGRRVGRERAGRRSRVLGLDAVRIGALAVVAAVLLPLLVPGQSHNLLSDAFHGRGGGGAAGFGATVEGGTSVSPFARLKGSLAQGDPVDVLDVHIDGNRSKVEPFYLKTNVLNDYGSEGFSAADHGATVDIDDAQPPAGQFAIARYTARITVDRLTGNPALFSSPVAVSGLADGTQWSDQDGLALTPTVRRGQEYSEVVDQIAPTPSQLATARENPEDPSLASSLRVPNDLPSPVRSLVASLTGTADSAYAAARAINGYFADGTHGFVYSLDVPVGDSGSALVDFLDSKQGYCQQYAAAAAIMMRAAGIPARVALGYMHEPTDPDGNFTVSSTDAHAWVEAYFPGFGWVPFDPTPAAGLSGGQAGDLPWAKHDYSTGSAGPNANSDRPSRPSASTSSAPSTAAPSPSSSSPVAGAAAPTGGGTGAALVPLVTMLAVLLVLGVLLTPAAARGRRRRTRLAAGRAGDVDSLWAELADTAVDLGYGWSDARSPRQVAAWLAAQLSAHVSERVPAKVSDRGQELDELASAVEVAHFAPPGAGVDVRARTRLTGDLQSVMAALRSARSRGTRVRAALLPPSLRLPVAFGGRRRRNRRH